MLRQGGVELQNLPPCFRYALGIPRRSAVAVKELQDVARLGSEIAVAPLVRYSQNPVGNFLGKSHAVVQVYYVVLIHRKRAIYYFAVPEGIGRVYDVRSGSARALWSAPGRDDVEILKLPILLRAGYVHGHSAAGIHVYVFKSQVGVGIEIEGVFAVVVVHKPVHSADFRRPVVVCAGPFGEFAVIGVRDGDALRLRRMVYARPVRREPFALGAEMPLRRPEPESRALAESVESVGHGHHHLHGHRPAVKRIFFIADKLDVEIRGLSALGGLFVSYPHERAERVAFPVPVDFQAGYADAQTVFHHKIRGVLHDRMLRQY